MGFKRTSEGRVFFQSGQEQDGSQGYSQANDPDKGQAAPFNPPNISPPNQMQLQILGLLKSLNERLRATQADRDYLRSELETYKGLVHDLKRQAEGLEHKIGTQKSGDPDKSGEIKKLAAEAAQELAETRKTMAELEERAEKTENELKRQVAQIKQNEAAIIQKQADLEKLQETHQAEISRRIEDRSRELSVGHTKQWEQLMARIEKREQAMTLRLSHAEDQAKTASDKVEEALSSTAKIDRKLEKTLQDRTRLIRKLERIEETVIQTHEALNARAMVLLTDQNTASQSALPYQAALDKALAETAAAVQSFAPGDEELAAPRAEPGALPAAKAPALPIWWKKSLKMNAPAMTGIVVVALLAGWFVSHVQTPSLPLPAETLDQTALQEENTGAEPSAPAEEPDNRADAFLEPDSAEEPSPSPASDLTEPAAGQEETPATPQDQAFNKAMDKFVQDGTSPAEASAIAAKDDLGTKPLTEQDKIEALLENKSDDVAARLNAIEPGSPAPETAADTGKPAPTQLAEQALPSAPVASAPKTTSELPLQQQGAPAKSIPVKDIAARVKPDSALPPLVKEIETKAFQGSPEAQHDLAAIYTAGHGGVKQDYKRAATWFEIAAEGGVSNAAYNLGVLYHQGIGVKQDLKTALSWYQKAAEKGHPEAQYNLGIAHIEGIGLPYDAKKAAQYFENAARAGVMEAAYNLGLIYENGLLGKAQPDEALMWYKTAADKGSPEAKAALDHLAKSLDIRLEDVNKLVEGMQSLKSGTAAPAVKQPAKTNVPVKSSEPAPAAAAKSSAEQGESAEAVPLDPGPSPERELTSKVQEQLMSFGLYPGPADGLDGPLTEDAIRSYQTAYGLDADGKVSQPLLKHMMAQSVKAITEGLSGSAGNQ